MAHFKYRINRINSSLIQFFTTKIHVVALLPKYFQNLLDRKSLKTTLAETQILFYLMHFSLSGVWCLKLHFVDAKLSRANASFHILLKLLKVQH